MSSNKTRAERIEILAAIEHDQWMSWAKSLMENESLSTMRIDRWSSLMVPYSDLPEEMREHDRKWARLALDALPPDPPRGDGWNSLRKLREWAESKIVGADHPYVGPSAPASDDIWGAMVMMADRLLAYADACEKDRPQLAKDLRDRMGWAQPPAELAQDDEAAIRDAEKRDEDRAKGDEPDPLEDNSILTSADIAELAEGAEMFVGDRVGGPKNRGIAEYEMVCSRSEYVAMARNLERFARENADLRAKLAAYEAHQSYRPLIPGNLIDRIDEHGQEWTRTERVRAAVAELVQPQTVEEITRLQEKLAVAEERNTKRRK